MLGKVEGKRRAERWMDPVTMAIRVPLGDLKKQVRARLSWNNAVTRSQPDGT